MTQIGNYEELAANRRRRNVAINVAEQQKHTG